MTTETETTIQDFIDRTLPVLLESDDDIELDLVWEQDDYPSLGSHIAIYRLTERMEQLASQGKHWIGRFLYICLEERGLMKWETEILLDRFLKEMN